MKHLAKNISFIMALFLITPFSIWAQEVEEFLSEDWLERFEKTDWSKSDIALDQLIAVKLPEETLDALNNPDAVAVQDVQTDFADTEPMIVVTQGGETRAYPVRYLLWYHVVNDRLGDAPIAVTYNPYTDSFVVFSRIINGVEAQIDDTGLLYRASLVLKESVTGSLFLQINGVGSVGTLHEEVLTAIPSQYVSFSYFNRTYGSDATVMAEPDISAHDWVILGKTPLAGYETFTLSPYHIGKTLPNSQAIRHFDRVISYGPRRTAWSYHYIRNRKEIRINADRVRIRWEKGLNSTLDTFDITEGRDMGTVHVEQQNAQGQWQPILFYRDLQFAYVSFFPNRRIFHDTRLRLNDE